MSAALSLVADPREEARAWFGEFFADSGRVRLAERDPDEDDEWQEYGRGIPVDRLDDIAEWVVKRAESVDVFACPYAHNGPRREGQAVSRRHVHADIDGPLDLAKVRSVSGMAVASGSVSASGKPHAHVYVRLSEEVTPEAHTALCEALGRRVGGEYRDPSKVGDADALRPAGTRNHKGETPAEVRWLIWPDDEGVKTWKPEALARLLGLDGPVKPAPTDEVEPRGEVVITGSVARRLDGLARSVTDAPRGEGNGRLTWAAWRAGAICAAATDPPPAEQVRADLVEAYMDRPVPHGESVEKREREARRTALSGWEAGTKDPGAALGNDDNVRTKTTMTEASPTCPVHGDQFNRLCGTCQHLNLWAQDEGRRRHEESDGEDWQPIRLSETADMPPPSVLRVGDKHLLIPGQIHGVHGDSDSGKTFLAYLAVAQEVAKGNAALIIDYEMGAAQARERLSVLGLSDEDTDDAVIFVEPGSPLGQSGLERISREVERTGRSLTVAVIDAVAGSMAVSALSDNDAVDVAAWLGGLPERIVRRWPTCASLHVDHLPKNVPASKSLDPVGSQRKRAGVHGQFWIRRMSTFSRQQDGYSLITVAKYRSGEYARGQEVAALEGGPQGFGLVEVDLSPDRVREQSVLRWFATKGDEEPTSKTDAAKGATGDKQANLLAVERLVEGGDLVEVAAPSGRRGQWLALPEWVEDDREV